MLKRSSKPTKEQQLPAAQRAAHGVGHVLNDLVSSVWFSYLILFLTKVVELSNRNTGIVILLGQVADGIFTPFIGIICDNTVCHYGRRKIWHLIGTALVTVSFPLLLIRLPDEDTSDVLKMVYFVGVAAVFQFGWGCVQISHLSLIPEISRSPNERVDLNATRSAVTFLCGIFVFAVTWVLLGQSSERKITPHIWKQFMYLSFIIIGTGNLFNIIFHVILNEPRSSAVLEQLENKQHSKAQLYQPSIVPDSSVASSRISAQILHSEIGHLSDMPASSMDLCCVTQDDTASERVTCAQCECVTTINSTQSHQKTSKIVSNSVTSITEESVTNNNKLENDANNNNVPNSQDDCVTKIDRSLLLSPPKTKKDWLKHTGLYKTGVIYMCTRLVVNISQSYLPLYLLETLGFEKEAIAYFPLVVLVSAVLSSLVVKPLTKRLGCKITYILGTVMSLGACAWFYLQTVDTRQYVYGATVLMGSGGSVMLVTSLSTISDLVGYDKTSGAFIYGIISFSDKLSSGVVIAIIQELNPKEHQVDGCVTCREYVRYVQSFAPGVAAFLALLTMSLFFKSTLVCNVQGEIRDVEVNVDQQMSSYHHDIVQVTSTNNDSQCPAKHDGTIKL